MSMIAGAFNPDISRYEDGEYSESEFYWGQYCSTRALLAGATAILEESQQNCDDCSDAYDLLKTFQKGMEAAKEGVLNSKRPPAPQEMSADEIREKMGDEPNLLVCLYSTNRKQTKEWFIVNAKDPKAVEAA